jgi:ribonuclease P protein component
VRTAATIKSSREIDGIFRGAARAAHPLLIVLAARTPEGRGPSGRVAFIAGKKIGGAVFRNRSRRVLREAVRRVGGPWASWDVLVIARPGTAGAPISALDEALKDALTRVGVL